MFGNLGSDESQENLSHLSECYPAFAEASSESHMKTGCSEPTLRRVGQTLRVRVRGNFLEKVTPGESTSLATEKMAGCSEQRARPRPRAEVEESRLGQGPGRGWLAGGTPAFKVMEVGTWRQNVCTSC